MQGIAFTILIGIMIFLFAFTFAVLGKGEYDPSMEEDGGSGEEHGARVTQVVALA